MQADQFLVDDLEQFAEEMSQYAFLTNEDQSDIAEKINTVIMAFEQLRNQCKERTNR